MSNPEQFPVIISGVRSSHQPAAPAPGGRIVAIDPGSPAEAAGIRSGDVLLAVNGRPLRDILDYQFYTCEDEATLHLRRGEADAASEWQVRLAVDGSLGIHFAESTFDGIRRCRNRCPFCFVTQLPKGMRRSLYIKDDDYRYSVGYGSFVTLSNLTDDDWQRLAEQHLGPLRISVHATDPALRRRMLGNPNAPDVVDQLRRLGEWGLRAHTQLVLCPGVNDGAQLDRSVSDLAALYPTVQSIAAVPVGLTHRNRNPDLRLYTSEEALAVVSQVARWQRDFRRRLGTGLVYLGDEFYFLAGRRFPAARQYDGYPQYENGVGLVRVLLDEWARLRRRDLPKAAAPVHISVVCGTRIAGLLGDIAAGLSVATGARFAVVPVRNEFFGPSVNVSGLLTGGDVLRDSRASDLGDIVVLPRAMLDAPGERFLDDLMPADLAAALGRPIKSARNLRELAACALL